MNVRKITLWIVLAGLALILSACALPNSPGADEPTTAPAPITNVIPLVSATAKIIPEQFASLSVNAAGVVAEVPVSEGDFVSEGQLLIQIKGGEQARAAVAAAQFELTNTQVALDELYENTNVLAADALKTAEDTEDALEDLLDRKLQEALALQAIADAEKAIENTQRTYTYTTNTADQADIDAAKAQVILAEDALEDAIDDFKDYEDLDNWAHEIKKSCFMKNNPENVERIAKDKLLSKKYKKHKDEFERLIPQLIKYTNLGIGEMKVINNENGVLEIRTDTKHKFKFESEVLNLMFLLRFSNLEGIINNDSINLSEYNKLFYFFLSNRDIADLLLRIFDDFHAVMKSSINQIYFVSSSSYYCSN